MQYWLHEVGLFVRSGHHGTQLDHNSARLSNKFVTIYYFCTCCNFLKISMIWGFLLTTMN